MATTTEHRVACGHPRCNATCNILADNDWIRVQLEKRNRKSVWFFCSPRHAGEMLARVVSQLE